MIKAYWRFRLCENSSFRLGKLCTTWNRHGGIREDYSIIYYWPAMGVRCDSGGHLAIAQGESIITRHFVNDSMMVKTLTSMLISNRTKE